MKHFEKKMKQKTSIESPRDAFSTKYTENIQNEKRVKNEATDMIFDAKFSGNVMQRTQKSIRPPSSVASGMRLKSVRHREISEKGSRNASPSGVGLQTDIGRVNKKPKNPATGPPRASINSSL